MVVFKPKIMMLPFVQNFTPRIFLSDSDFIAMTKNGAMCNAQGQLGVEEFEMVMREQILNYTMSRLSATSEFWNVSDQDFTELGTLKQLLMEQLSVKKELEATKRNLEGVLDHLRSIRNDPYSSECPDTSHALMKSSGPVGHRVRRVSRDICKEISSKMDLLRIEILDILDESIGHTDKESESDCKCEAGQSIWPQDDSLSLHSSKVGSDGIYTENLIAAHIEGLVQRGTMISSSSPLESNGDLGLPDTFDQGMDIISQANGRFAPSTEEIAFCSPAAALSNEVEGPASLRPNSLCVKPEYDMKVCAKRNSTSCSSREESSFSCLHSQTQTRSNSGESQNRYPLANQKCISAGKDQVLEHKSNNNGSVRERGNSFPRSLHSGKLIIQEHGCDAAMFLDQKESNLASHSNIKFSSRRISGARSCSLGSEFCERSSIQKDANRNGVLDLGTFSCLPGTRHRGDLQPTAVDVPSDVATGLADCTESEVILLSGCA
jgi:hypothetical protein